ncbi:MAG: penicillin acylase family protein, partial [Rhodospirillales bacterium]|nr:penicillin acylase family protein [Rhodospirillales bacterium]
MAFRPSCLLLLPLALLASAASAQSPIPFLGLDAEVQVIRDKEGIPHIIAQNEHDLILMQGWVHARDRLFQMDFRRRQASGTLAELVGGAALASDVELRVLGLRRAAERSLPLLSTETQAALDAYTAGVNAYVTTHPLPPEYLALERTFDPWTAVDSLAVGKLIAFSLSFDLDDIERTETLVAYVTAGLAEGFDGTALFLEDTNRSAPFDPAATVPDANLETATVAATVAAESRRNGRAAAALRPETLAMAREYLERLRALPEVRGAVRLGDDPRGSNEWAVAGENTVSGRPLIANDPHLDLDTPSTFYQNHLKADPAGFDVIGGSFAGVPYVILGQNKTIAWGATVNPMDVTDVFQEQVVPDPSSPSLLSTLYLGNPEPIIPIPQVFRVNVIGDGVPDNLIVVPPDDVNIPAAVLIVPRRNDGPIVALDAATGAALSIQYTGFSGTREIQAFRAWDLAGNLDDFVAGLQNFDFGSENWAYVDTAGNIAYFTSAELPIREDLQAGFVAGRPPFFIRNGLGGNEWLPVSSPQPGQAVPFEILPFAEMPQIVNPPAGFFVNANNDPAGISLDNNPLNQLRPGGGIFYLNPGHDMGNRAGRIKQLLERKLAEGPVSPEDMQEIQADVVLLDAQVFTPLIVRAFRNARHG